VDAFVTVAEDLAVNFYQEKLHHLCMLQIFIGTSNNGTTFLEEMSTANSSDATLHKSIPPYFYFVYIFKPEVYFIILRSIEREIIISLPL